MTVDREAIEARLAAAMDRPTYGDDDTRALSNAKGDLERFAPADLRALLDENAELTVHRDAARLWQTKLNQRLAAKHIENAELREAVEQRNRIIRSYSDPNAACPSDACNALGDERCALGCVAKALIEGRAVNDGPPRRVALAAPEPEGRVTRLDDPWATGGGTRAEPEGTNPLALDDETRRGLLDARGLGTILPMGSSLTAHDSGPSRIAALNERWEAQGLPVSHWRIMAESHWCAGWDCRTCIAIKTILDLDSEREVQSEARRAAESVIDRLQAGEPEGSEL